MQIVAGHYQLPLGVPPSLVHVFSTFGESLHGEDGDEPYRNGFWVLNLASEGDGWLEIAGQSYPFCHGTAILAPADVPHVYHFRRPTIKTYAHFRLSPGTAQAPFPVVQDLGERFEWFRTNILSCRGLWSTEPERAQAVLWNLLWQLTDGPAGGSGPIHHPLIRRLLDHIEQNIARPLEPVAVAEELGCSVTHLNRLCRAAFDLPLASYIRRLRLDRAVHMLAHTSAGIVTIAQEVGLPDLQHFNKLVRGHTGKSPRELRRG